ncbi:MAG: lysophospholipid acyltransferase family protein [Planctomycetota bacterium]|jgi:1-acyl-sn-glycerol-3-phosphate acyltransferase
MTATGRPLAPTAEEIERRFRAPAVIVTRPIILGGIGLLKGARRFGWNATGLDNLEAATPPLILAANHQSHADTAAILGTLIPRIRRRTAVAAALDVFGNGRGNDGGPSLKRDFLQLIVAAGFHAFAFDRHGPPMRSLRTAFRLINHGWSVLMYPEGTRSRSGRLAPFKAGVGILARFTGRPVIPIHVRGGRGVLPCGAFMPRPGRITVCYGEPLRFERRDTLPGFAGRLRESVRALDGVGA